MTQYSGSCHCGKIAFDFTTEAPITSALSCNCSICQKRGTLLTFGPRDQLKLRTSEDKLITYTFNTHKIQHHFCSTCGCAPFSEGDHPGGGKMAAVNVRCLDDFDISALEINFHDGKKA